MTKVCAKCGEKERLSKSHSIPKSFFRKIHKRDGNGNGQLISVSSGPEKVHYTQNTGEASMLCADCEGWFNKEYDSFIDRVMNNMSPQQSMSGVRKPVYLQVDTDRLSKFILSVFWRSSLSENQYYDNFCPPPSVSQELGDLLFHRPSEIKKKFSFSVHRMYVAIDSLDQFVVDDFVMPPGVIDATAEHPEAWVFAARGCLFTAYWPRLTNTQAKKLQCYMPAKRAVRMPKRDVLKDPAVWPILKAGLKKGYEGHTKIR